MILTTKLYFQTLSIMQQDIFDHFLSSQRTGYLKANCAK